MKVIGSGFGRTGTLSLQAALQQLGFGPCYHMVEVIKHRGHPQKWLRIARGEQPDWRALFRNFEATVDFPACVYYADLLREFPEREGRALGAKQGGLVSQHVRNDLPIANGISVDGCVARAD